YMLRQRARRRSFISCIRRLTFTAVLKPTAAHQRSRASSNRYHFRSCHTHHYQANELVVSLECANSLALWYFYQSGDKSPHSKEAPDSKLHGSRKHADRLRRSTASKSQ